MELLPFAADWTIDFDRPQFSNMSCKVAESLRSLRKDEGYTKSLELKIHVFQKKAARVIP